MGWSLLGLLSVGEDMVLMQGDRVLVDGGDVLL